MIRVYISLGYEGEVCLITGASTIIATLENKGTKNSNGDCQYFKQIFGPITL